MHLCGMMWRSGKAGSCSSPKFSFLSTFPTDVHSEGISLTFINSEWSLHPYQCCLYPSCCYSDWGKNLSVLSMKTRSFAKAMSTLAGDPLPQPPRTVQCRCFETKTAVPYLNMFMHGFLVSRTVYSSNNKVFPIDVSS